jgi:hypothetical protein
MKPRRGLSWNVAGPAVAGVIALVVAVYLGWLTFRHDGPDRPVTVATHRLVNHKGGYSLKVPQGMKAVRSGAATRILDKDRTVTVTVTPTRRGRPADNNKAVLRAMAATYRTVHLTTSQRQRIDHRPAVASYGQAVTRKGVALRFVLITVKGHRHNFAISTFTAADSDPRTVLPRVRAIANGFHVLSAKEAAK